MNKLIAYLQINPMEAAAICEGRAMPVEKLSAKEILTVIKTVSIDKNSTMMKYWG